MTTLETAIAVPFTEGFVPFPYQGETFQTYYKLFGSLENRTRTPIVVLHGGPGLSHDYLLPLADLTSQSYPVFFYDQLGNARSTHLPDKPPTFWTIDLFLDELDNLLTHFGIQNDYHVVGHSWGGMMISEYIVRRQPSGLRRLVLSDSPPAISLWRRSFMELLQPLPPEVKEAIANGYKNQQKYWAALMEVYAVHGCREKPFPEELEYSLLQNNGPNADRSVSNAP